MEQPITFKQLNIPIKKVAIAIWIILTIGLLAGGIYLGIEKIKAVAYQKGIQDGQVMVNNAIMGQLINTGRLQLNLPPNEEGVRKSLILIPMPANEQPATTTE